MGVILFYAGIGLLALAVILSVITAATASRAKRKIQERMKEKY